MKETRNCKIGKRNEDSRIVEGYAIVFNSESRDLGGFTEVIEPTALEGVLQQSDILCLLNHNEDRGILARSKYGAQIFTNTSVVTFSFFPSFATEA